MQNTHVNMYFQNEGEAKMIHTVFLWLENELMKYKYCGKQLSCKSRKAVLIEL